MPPRRVEVEARAKLNLGLVVGPRRADGFHDLATLFQSITLADTLIIRPRPRGFRLVVRHEESAVRGRTRHHGASSVPSGPKNLVLAAARRVSRLWGLDRGASFTLIKRIPARAGLGGGSADAAATIAGLIALHGIRVPLARRLEVAAMLGSDVPFALRGGTALALGRGDRIAPARLLRPFRALVAMPEWTISTANAYAALDRRKKVLTAWGVKLRSAKLLGRNRISVTRAMRLGNSFEEALGDRRSEFISLCARLREAGATEVRMTGSGSAVFGVLAPGAHAKEVVARFEGNETLYVVSSAGSGLRLE